METTQKKNYSRGDILSGLNNRQTEAVRHIDGPLLILAGAGSGKTRVLVHRIAYLILEANVPPWSILGITFTNKAAAEMKNRIKSLLPDESAAIWISTFHSACVRMLRRDIDRIGYAKNFVIYDADDQLSLIKECIKEKDLSDKQFVPKAVLDQIGRAKDEMISSDDMLSSDEMLSSDKARARAMRRTNSADDAFYDSIREIYALYQKKLKKLNALDFDDIILMTIKMLRENDDILAYYQNKFAYVLVDEYQDTNSAQYTLISLLCGKRKNICVVGDDDQSIYGWRGANIGNILGFENDYRNAKVIKLEQNYRSTKIILSAANSVIHKNKHRKVKNLWTENDDGDAIECVKSDNERDEAAYVVRMIKTLKQERGINYNDFSVLYRINAQSRVLENIFAREGVPYRIIGGFKFFDRKEIKDIIAYLRLLQNPSDDLSFKRIINVPKRGVGAATIAKLENLASDLGLSLYETVAETTREPGAFPEIKSASSKLYDFYCLLRDLIKESKDLKTADILELTLQRSGISAMYEADPSEEARSRLENLLEFKSEILDFDKNYESDDIFYYNGIDGAYSDAVQSGDGGRSSNGAGLEEFLAHISLISDIDNYDEDNEKVSLMTMHSAKGLEYDVVFVTGVEEGIFPGLKSMSDPLRLEEERRLCYVAITRAKKRLFFTCASSRTLFGNTTYNKLSRFIEDIPDNLLSNIADNALYPSYNGNNKINKAVFFQKQNYKTPPADFILNTRRAAEDGAGMYESGRVYAVGDVVGHKKYGEGRVTNRRYDGGDYIIEIEFVNAGMKRFIESMVKLRSGGDAEIRG